MKEDFLEEIGSRIVSAWTGHGPFAIWLSLREHPKLTVDLGVDFGLSTLCWASCQQGKVVGVDLFQGDVHAGVRDTYQSVVDSWQYFRKKYKLTDNLVLIKSSFDEVAGKWLENGYAMIDILHIDGLHTYEAVKNDFSTWLPLIKSDGIILMHDTQSFPNDVGLFFKEISYPKFQFLHTHGLGVVCRNTERLNAIFNESKDMFGPVSELEK